MATLAHALRATSSAQSQGVGTARAIVRRVYDVHTARVVTRLFLYGGEWLDAMGMHAHAVTGEPTPACEIIEPRDARCMRYLLAEHGTPASGAWTALDDDEAQNERRKQSLYRDGYTPEQMLLAAIFGVDVRTMTPEGVPA